MQHHVVGLNGTLIQYIDSPSMELCKLAIQVSWEAIAHIKNQTHALCMMALDRSPEAIRYIRYQTDEMCLKAVRAEPMLLKYVHIQTEEIIKEALNVEYNFFVRHEIIKHVHATFKDFATKFSIERETLIF
jgi:hypothetical protein